MDIETRAGMKSCTLVIADLRIFLFAIYRNRARHES